MIKWLEKWALKRLLKRVSANIPKAELLWKKHSAEIEKKIADAIKKVLVDISKNYN